MLTEQKYAFFLIDSHLNLHTMAAKSHGYCESTLQSVIDTYQTPQ